jgi:hypothetical protein
MIGWCLAFGLICPDGQCGEGGRRDRRRGSGQCCHELAVGIGVGDEHGERLKPG